MRLLQREGLRSTLQLAGRALASRGKTRQHARQLDAILENHPGAPLIVFLPRVIDWHVPCFQRPHHLAVELAKLGYLYFFCSPNRRYDRIDGFERVADSCYLTDRFDLVAKLAAPKILHVYSTDVTTTYAELRLQQSRGNRLLYEYVDEIHPAIANEAIPEWVFERHDRLLSNERCVVVATADTLLQEVAARRSKNYTMATNGVDFDHFAGEWPVEEAHPELRELVAHQRPILGYYGALASWLDYDLVRYVARQRPDWEIVLIGVEHDDSLARSKIRDLANVRVLGPIPYARLPQSACHFTVATIPFKSNTITRATSPLKLFEYMALGIPVVTTEMPECRKHDDVVTVAGGWDDFISGAQRATELRHDPTFRGRLRQAAKQHTWAKKAEQIDELLRSS